MPPSDISSEPVRFGGSPLAGSYECTGVTLPSNIGQILAVAGLGHKDAVFTNVYFVDPAGYKGATYGKLNSIYKDFFRLGTPSWVAMLD